MKYAIIFHRWPGNHSYCVMPFEVCKSNTNIRGIVTSYDGIVYDEKGEKEWVFEVPKRNVFNGRGVAEKTLFKMKLRGEMV